MYEPFILNHITVFKLKGLWTFLKLFETLKITSIGDTPPNLGATLTWNTLQMLNI